MEPSAQIVRHTGVKRAALARCQDVDPIALLHVLIGNGIDPMVKPWDDGGVSKKAAPSRPLSRDLSRTDRSPGSGTGQIPQVRVGNADKAPQRILSTPHTPARILSPCLFDGLSGGPSRRREQAGRGWGKEVTVLSWQVRWLMIPGTVDPGGAVRLRRARCGGGNTQASVREADPPLP
jgi:hypothetical protein